jgi:putative SOS response-associated peptidase YedK
MCYSAQIEADYRKFSREYGAVLSFPRFVELFWTRRREGGWNRIPKAVRAAFAQPVTEQERELAGLVAAGDRELANVFEAELFQQRARLADAERALATRTTKKAENDRRIATDKIARAQRNLSDLRRTDPVADDARIFPGHYAPVMVMKDGQRVIVPMRYQCRLPGWTEEMEKRKPGTYNARRDSLDGAWRQLFGYRHGILVINAFFENVARHRVEHRELRPGEQAENVVLEFRPRPPRDMLVACLWSFSKGKDGEADLFSFAAITDEPPPEVAAAGHDRCIVPIRRENIDAWLEPDPDNLAALHAILADRERGDFAHRLAA